MLGALNKGRSVASKKGEHRQQDGMLLIQSDNVVHESRTNEAHVKHLGSAANSLRSVQCMNLPHNCVKQGITTLNNRLARTPQQHAHNLCCHQV